MDHPPVFLLIHQILLREWERAGEEEAGIGSDQAQILLCQYQYTLNIRDGPSVNHQTALVRACPPSLGDEQDVGTMKYPHFADLASPGQLRATGILAQL